MCDETMDSEFNDRKSIFNCKRIGESMAVILEESRKRIDEIDNQISTLFLERMNVASQVAKYKQENKMTILDSGREGEVLANVTRDIPDDMVEYMKLLYNTLFAVSKSYQEMCIVGKSEVEKEVERAIGNATAVFPKRATVACQGIKGSNSMTACKKIFSVPDIMYMDNFAAIFKAVESGLCKYGMLPIENNLHGSVTEVYDLMKKHNFKIVRSVKVKITHTLLAKKGAKLKDIKTIYSHPQAIGQCSNFLERNPNVKVVEYDNTATAAEFVANNDDKTVAAIASQDCAKLYGLEVIDDNVQNSHNNYTRFICIAKEGEIYKGSNKISLMFTLPHNPGSLYSILSKFTSVGVNVSKLESRPIPAMDFEFMFYIDFDGDICDIESRRLLTQVEQSADYFSYLGSYWEI